MTMANRKAFTLVEMLVVIVIIGMLAALLVPALIGARKRARQAECVHKQHQLATALQQYESSKRHLPGYINSFGSVAFTNLADSRTTPAFSWVVVILQYLDRNDLWEQWRDGTREHVDLSQVMCPSDSLVGKDGLSYVVNAGLASCTDCEAAEETGTDCAGCSSGTCSECNLDTPSDAVFLDRFSERNPKSVSTDQIADGASQTIMFSENLQAGKWYDTKEVELGMVWVPASTSSTALRINEDRDATVSDIAHARPSSNHVDGVVVTYCDGHQDFLKDDIDPDVYRDLMDPDDDLP